MKAYRTELDVNNKQRTSLLRHAGTARFAYNWGLRQKIAAYKRGEKAPTAIDLHRLLNTLKSSKFPWMYEVSKCSPQEALRNLDMAYRNFFRRCRNGAKKKGFPRFKSRKRGIGTFTVNGAIRVTDRTVQLPRLGVLRLKEHGYLPTSVRVTSAAVSERAGHWFVSIKTKEEPQRTKGEEILGVDVGIKHLAVLSDGTTFDNPRALESAEYRLRRLQRAVSRKVKGSVNRRKATARLARQHYLVACLRSDTIRKVTDAITKRAAVLGIESLNVAGMLKNHHLAHALTDAALGELLRQMSYKMKWSDGIIVEAPRFYPSSKTCSTCGYVLDMLPLSVREWDCPKCRTHHDRDQNAAINLRNLAASSAAIKACGGRERSAPPTKQEPNTVEGIVLNG